MILETKAHHQVYIDAFDDFLHAALSVSLWVSAGTQRVHMLHTVIA